MLKMAVFALAVAVPGLAFAQGLVVNTSACGRGSLDASCMVKPGSGLTTNSDGSVAFAQPVLTSVSNTPSQIVQTDHLGVTTARGIANRSSNVSYATPATGGTVTVTQGTAYVILTGSGTVASQPVQLPTSPLDGDQVIVSAGPGLTVTASLLGIRGTQIGLAMMRPMTSIALLYQAPAGDWVPRLMPATLYGDTQAVAAAKAAGYVLTVNGTAADANSNVTLALTTGAKGDPGAASTVPGPAGAPGPPGASQPAYTLPPATATTLGGVKQGANAAIAADGTLAVAAPYTDAQALAAAKAGLGSAAQQPSSAFDAAGLASAETARATAAESLKAPLASPALTGAPTAPTQTAGDATTKLATDAFVQTAVAAVPGLCKTGSNAFCGSAVTLANGTFTATITPACTIAPTLIQVTAKATGTGLGNQVNGSWTSSTTSTVSGLVTGPATLAVLGLTVIAPPTGTPVSVFGVCP